MTKKYGIRGISEAVLRFERGKTKIVCPFTGGNLISREPIPASYTTSNAIVQATIEDSEMFLHGKVYIMSEYGDVTPSAPAAVETHAKETVGKSKSKSKSKGSKSSDAKVIENVETYSDAVTALMAEGASVSEVASLDACIATAEKMNILFPNLK
jgi:hypothetical protein